ncbi:MAG: hypothetical protein IJ809_02045, partial [Clostridia bacterium]|nr:hypothetical protein [Clostridia bacterium]
RWVYVEVPSYEKIYNQYELWTYVSQNEEVLGEFVNDRVDLFTTKFKTKTSGYEYEYTDGDSIADDITSLNIAGDKEGGKQTYSHITGNGFEEQNARDVYGMFDVAKNQVYEMYGKNSFKVNKFLPSGDIKESTFYLLDYLLSLSEKDRKEIVKDDKIWELIENLDYKDKDVETGEPVTRISNPFGQSKNFNDAYISMIKSKYKANIEGGPADFSNIKNIDIKNAAANETSDVSRWIYIEIPQKSPKIYIQYELVTYNNTESKFVSEPADLFLYQMETIRAGKNVENGLLKGDRLYLMGKMDSNEESYEYAYSTTQKKESLLMASKPVAPDLVKVKSTGDSAEEVNYEYLRKEKYKETYKDQLETQTYEMFRLDTDTDYEINIKTEFEALTGNGNAATFRLVEYVADRIRAVKEDDENKNYIKDPLRREQVDKVLYEDEKYPGDESETGGLIKETEGKYNSIFSPKKMEYRTGKDLGAYDSLEEFNTSGNGTEQDLIDSTTMYHSLGSVHVVGEDYDDSPYTISTGEFDSGEIIVIRLQYIQIPGRDMDAFVKYTLHTPKVSVIAEKVSVKEIADVVDMYDEVVYTNGGLVPYEIPERSRADKLTLLEKIELGNDKNGGNDEIKLIDSKHLTDWPDKYKEQIEKYKIYQGFTTDLLFEDSIYRLSAPYYFEAINAEEVITKFYLIDYLLIPSDNTGSSGETHYMFEALIDEMYGNSKPKEEKDVIKEGLKKYLLEKKEEKIQPDVNKLCKFGYATTFEKAYGKLSNNTERLGEYIAKNEYNNDITRYGYAISYAEYIDDADNIVDKNGNLVSVRGIKTYYGNYIPKYNEPNAKSVLVVVPDGKDKYEERLKQTQHVLSLHYLEIPDYSKTVTLSELGRFDIIGKLQFVSMTNTDENFVKGPDKNTIEKNDTIDDLKSSYEFFNSTYKEQSSTGTVESDYIPANEFITPYATNVYSYIIRALSWKVHNDDIKLELKVSLKRGYTYELRWNEHNGVENPVYYDTETKVYQYIRAPFDRGEATIDTENIAWVEDNLEKFFFDSEKYTNNRSNNKIGSISKTASLAAKNGYYTNDNGYFLKHWYYASDFTEVNGVKLEDYGCRYANFHVYTEKQSQINANMTFVKTAFADHLHQALGNSQSCCAGLEMLLAAPERAKTRSKKDFNSLEPTGEEYSDKDYHFKKTYSCDQAVEWWNYYKPFISRYSSNVSNGNYTYYSGKEYEDIKNSNNSGIVDEYYFLKDNGAKYGTIQQALERKEKSNEPLEPDSYAARNVLKIREQINKFASTYWSKYLSELEKYKAESAIIEKKNKEIQKAIDDWNTEYQKYKNQLEAYEKDAEQVDLYDESKKPTWTRGDPPELLPFSDPPEYKVGQIMQTCGCKYEIEREAGRNDDYADCEYTKAEWTHATVLSDEIKEYTDYSYSLKLYHNKEDSFTDDYEGSSNKGLCKEDMWDQLYSGQTLLGSNGSYKVDVGNDRISKVPGRVKLTKAKAGEPSNPDGDRICVSCKLDLTVQVLSVQFQDVKYLFHDPEFYCTHGYPYYQAEEEVSKDATYKEMKVFSGHEHKETCYITCSFTSLDDMYINGVADVDAKNPGKNVTEKLVSKTNNSDYAFWISSANKTAVQLRFFGPNGIYGYLGNTDKDAKEGEEGGADVFVPYNSKVDYTTGIAWGDTVVTTTDYQERPGSYDNIIKQEQKVSKRNYSGTITQKYYSIINFHMYKVAELTLHDKKSDRQYQYGNVTFDFGNDVNETHISSVNNYKLLPNNNYNELFTNKDNTLVTPEREFSFYVDGVNVKPKLVEVTVQGKVADSYIAIRKSDMVVDFDELGQSNDDTRKKYGISEDADDEDRKRNQTDESFDMLRDNYYTYFTDEETGKEIETKTKSVLTKRSDSIKKAVSLGNYMLSMKYVYKTFSTGKGLPVKYDLPAVKYDADLADEEDAFFSENQANTLIESLHDPENYIHTQGVYTGAGGKIER